MPRLILLMLMSSLLAACAPSHSVTRTLDGAVLANHRTVAILPFEVGQQRLRFRDIQAAGSDTSAATRKRMQQRWTEQQQQETRTIAYQLQNQLMAQFEAQKPVRGYQVIFQPVDETNRRLLQAGITYENLPAQSMAALQRALGVDAILSGQTMLYQPLPKGVGLAARILLHEPLLLGNQPSAVPSSSATTNLTLHDCRSGQLAWRFDYERTGGHSLDPEHLAQSLVRAAVPSFPYARQ